MEISGRRAVVTGGGGGLGEVIVRAFAARQMHVLVADVDGAAARRVAADVDGSAVTADLAEPSGVDTVAAAAEEVDVLVNCAGGWSPSGRSYPDASPADWTGVLALNLTGPMRLLQRLRGPLARSPVGAAVSISSSAARGTGAYRAPEYAVAKAGLIRLTTSLTDWAERYGIRVSCVVPGWIGLPRALDEVAVLPPTERSPLVPPTEIAAEVVRLAADEDAAGRVVIMDEGRPAYPMGP